MPLKGAVALFLTVSIGAAAQEPGAKPSALPPAPGPVQLTSGRQADSNPKFSPDGGKIVYVSDKNKKLQVWSIHSDGSGPRALSSRTADEDPVYSPDGRLIAFATFGNNPKKKQFSLWLMDHAGGHPRAVLAGEASEGRHPCWSPDGRRLVWTHHNRLWIVTLKTRRARPLTKSPAKAYEFCGEWSPDGQWIAYQASDKVDWSRGSNYEIRLIRPDGRDEHPWSEQKINRFAGWSADSRFVFFQAGGQLFGAPVTRPRAAKSFLTFKGTDGTNVDLSSDGQWLVYDDVADQQKATGHLYKVRTFSAAFMKSFQPDGRDGGKGP